MKVWKPSRHHAAFEFEWAAFGIEELKSPKEALSEDVENEWSAETTKNVRVD